MFVAAFTRTARHVRGASLLRYMSSVPDTMKVRTFRRQILINGERCCVVMAAVTQRNLALQWSLQRLLWYYLIGTLLTLSFTSSPLSLSQSLGRRGS